MKRGPGGTFVAGPYCGLCQDPDSELDRGLEVGISPSSLVERVAARGLEVTYQAVVTHRRHLKAAGRPCAPPVRSHPQCGPRAFHIKPSPTPPPPRVEARRRKPPSCHFGGAAGPDVRNFGTDGSVELRIVVPAAAHVDARLLALGTSAVHALLLGLAALERGQGAETLRTQARLDTAPKPVRRHTWMLVDNNEDVKTVEVE